MSNEPDELEDEDESDIAPAKKFKFYPVEVMNMLLERWPFARLGNVYADYVDGVWVVDMEEDADRALRSRMVDLLKNNYKVSYVKPLDDMLRNCEEVARLTGDPVPGVINFTNGLVDTATMERRNHTPDYLSTLQYAVPWTPDAETPAFDQWAVEVVGKECLEWFLWIFGYLLVPGNPGKMAVFVKGDGANGKSTWFHMIDKIVGTRHISRVTLQRMADDRFAGAEIHRKVLNLVGDMGNRPVVDTELFKQITGLDEITAQRKYGQPFEFTSWCVPVFAANVIPRINDPTYAFMRRWWHLPFPNKFAETPGYEDQFTPELPGIAAKVIKIYLASGGVPPEMPAAARALREEFNGTADPIKLFLSDACVFDAAGEVERGRLHEAYKDWCDVENVQATWRMGRTTFYKRVAAVVGAPVRPGNDWVFRGIRRNGWGV